MTNLGDDSQEMPTKKASKEAFFEFPPILITKSAAVPRPARKVSY
jgi:hypothetical protein